MLPQKPVQRPSKLRIRQLVVLICLPFLGIVTAFGFMPQTATGPEGANIVVQEITLPQIEPSGNASTFWRYDRVQGGDNVAAVLRRLNVEDSAADSYLRTARAAESFRKLGAGKAVQAETDADGKLLALSYPDSTGGETLIEKASDKGYAVRTLPAQLERRIFMRTGQIRTTLFAAADEADLPEPAANQLADIFGTSIDFHHDLRPGDKFSVVYEVSYRNGEPVRLGRVLAAEVINRDRAYQALYYEDGEGGSYYSPEGHSMHQAFLRSPVEFSRISSGFTASRFHPLLHKWRAHKGVDFAAPIGTKVKATAEGTVSFVGKQTGYGNVIFIKHEGRFSTVYGHLSRFAAHLHTGQRVAQGEVIGYVGKSGWATGPHLHYEFRVDNKQRNPMTVAMPTAASIGNERRNAFLDATRELSARLGVLHNINLAQID